ncbi:MAG: hypothetical protein ACTSO2_15060 [Promethearchaeota archaeon]
MTPIYIGTATNYTEVNRLPNTYYYAVIVGNGIDNTSISNIVFVEVKYPTNIPIINQIQSPDYDGNYTVSWNNVEYS